MGPCPNLGLRNPCFFFLGQGILSFLPPLCRSPFPRKLTNFCSSHPSWVFCHSSPPSLPIFPPTLQLTFIGIIQLTLFPLSINRRQKAAPALPPLPLLHLPPLARRPRSLPCWTLPRCTCRHTRGNWCPRRASPSGSRRISTRSPASATSATKSGERGSHEILREATC